MACRGAGRSAAFVDGEFGIAQVAIVIDQIMRAIVWRNRKLLIRREDQNNVAVGLEPLLGILKLFLVHTAVREDIARSDLVA